MGSFLDAQSLGFQWIELDVISTKDKEVICSHNFDLEMETVGRGYITELDYNALNPIISEHNINIQGQNILPRLLDVFKGLDSNMKVNIEVKSPYAWDLRTARALSKILKNLPKKRIIISLISARKSLRITSSKATRTTLAMLLIENKTCCSWVCFFLGKAT